MHTEYRVELYATGDLSDDRTVLNGQDWTRLEYGLGHVGKIVRIMLEDSPRSLRSWDLFCEQVYADPNSAHGWGLWITGADGTSTYFGVDCSPVQVGSEWAGLGER